MRSLTQIETALERMRSSQKVVRALMPAVRRRAWALDNLTPRKVGNASLALWAYTRKRESTKAVPVVLKVDISPVCNLHCTVCVHARPDANSHPDLTRQEFRSSDRLTLDAFTALADDVSGRTMELSLYYVGDPLVHPELEAMCTIAAQRGLNTHVSTNFSFVLSDERIQRLVHSGLTHLTVCVDGLEQQSYERTRVGGRIDLVLDNLERLLGARRRAGSRFPRVEVQYIKYQHNLDQLGEAKRLCDDLGVDVFTDFWGSLHNYADRAPDPDAEFTLRPPRRLPRCTWPYFYSVVKFDGSVIPCCVHRIGSQYVPGADTRALGTVTRDGIRGVWNNEAYRSMRRLVAGRQPTPTDDRSFCAGCPKVYASKSHPRFLLGSHHRWEDLYRLDEAGTPVRLVRPKG